MAFKELSSDRGRNYIYYKTCFILKVCILYTHPELCIIYK
jgi:hypothetical protein